MGEWQRSPDIQNLTQLSKLYDLSVEQLLNPETIQVKKSPWYRQHPKWTAVMLSCLFLFCILSLGVIELVKKKGFFLLFDWFILILFLLMIFSLWAITMLFIPNNKKIFAHGAVLAGIFLAIFFYSLIPTRETLFQIGPNGKNNGIIKLDTQSGQAYVCRQRFFFFVYEKERIPYTVAGKIKTQWLSSDICALTYQSPDEKTHQFVATYGVRNDGIAYSSMINAMKGSWLMMETNTSGWQFISTKDGFKVIHGAKVEAFSFDDCVQFGTIAMVLCENGLPKYTISLDEGSTINHNDRVDSGKTMSLTPVAMTKTAPVVFTMISPEDPEPSLNDENLAMQTVIQMKEDPSLFPEITSQSTDYFTIAYDVILAHYQSYAVNGVDVTLQFQSIQILAGDLNDFVLQVESDLSACTEECENIVFTDKFRIMKTESGYIYNHFIFSDDISEELQTANISIDLAQIDTSLTKIFVPGIK